MRVGSRCAIKVGMPIRLMLVVVLAVATTLLVCVFWALGQTGGASGRSAFVFLILGFPLIVGAKAGWPQVVSIILTFAVYFVVGCLIVWQIFREN